MAKGSIWQRPVPLVEDPSPTPSFLNDKAWECFWHPVCTLKELEASDTGRGQRLQVKLLGKKLVVARSGSGTLIVLRDRCSHRSASLSLGWVEGDCVRCPYHGLVFDKAGQCVEVPSQPGEPIPGSLHNIAYDAEVAYDLVWVRLRKDVATEIPVCPPFNDPKYHCVLGPSYTWKTHAARRVENFTDLLHFPFIHPNTLGNREVTTFPRPDIHIEKGGLIKFRYTPLESGRFGSGRRGGLSPVAFTDYTLQLPFGVHVDLNFQNGEHNYLWIFASPIDRHHCRSFWFTCRTDDHDGADEHYIEFQEVILEEDVDVVESCDPEDIPFPKGEVALGADKLHTVYRRSLYQAVKAVDQGPEALAEFMAREQAEVN